MENRFKLARTQYNQHGSQSTKEVEKATGVTKSLIEDIESTAGKPHNVGYLTVKKMAEYYGVSSDYLLGLSETPSIDEDIQVACKMTGISQRGLERLREFSTYCAVNSVMNPFEALFSSREYVFKALSLNGDSVSTLEAFFVELSCFTREALSVEAENPNERDTEKLFSLQVALSQYGYTAVPKNRAAELHLQNACDILKEHFHAWAYDE